MLLVEAAFVVRPQSGNPTAIPRRDLQSDLLKHAVECTALSCAVHPLFDQARKRSLMDVLERVRSSTRLTITAQ